MSNSSKIEWTDATWNPIVGCSVVSPGCTGCYAMQAAWRLSHNPKTPQYDGTVEMVNGNSVWTGKVAFAESALTAPLSWRKPKRIFVNSMGDLFHEDVPDEWIDRVFHVMFAADHHQFQVLTKRAGRMLEYMSSPKTLMRLNKGGRPNNQIQFPFPNVWLGVSAEDQQRAEERIPFLLQTQAAVRFVSAEPLLGPIDLNRLHGYRDHPDGVREDWWESCLSGKRFNIFAGCDLNYPKLDWVIVGGESGKKARPMHPDWARSIRDQCKKHDVPFFFKQWGAWKAGRSSDAESDGGMVRVVTIDGDRNACEREGKWPCQIVNGQAMYRVGKRHVKRLLDGREWNELPREQP